MQQNSQANFEISRNISSIGLQGLGLQGNPSQQPQQFREGTQPQQPYPNQGQSPHPNQQYMQYPMYPQQGYPPQPVVYQAPPPYPPYNQMPNPTLVTQVSMNGFAIETIPQKAKEIYTFQPPCYTKVFMMPFPFFCMGLCMSRSTTIEFNRDTKMVTINTYCGYCSCCATLHTVRFADILSIKQIKRTQSTKKRFVSKYFIIVQTRTQEIEVSGGLFETEANNHEKRLEDMARKFGIYAK